MASDSPTPVFIFSLPRSGSTLLQRMLASHPEVTTATEPWILLPLLMARQTGGTYAIYRHEDAALAIEQFVEGLPEGDATFERSVREFVSDLYSAGAEPQHRFFVDKTPRYHLVAHRILHVFPEAKFIFLWRNPLAIASSIIKTWGNGRWNLFRYRVDLEDGPRNLVEAYRAHPEASLQIRYEDLVRDPSSVSEQVMDYLELDSSKGGIEQFDNVELEGVMGDKAGARYGASISTEPLNAWAEMLDSPVRKAWLRRYLGRLGDETLEAMGYRREELVASLDDAPNRLNSAIGDLVRLGYGSVYRGFDTVIDWRSRRYLEGAGRGPIGWAHDCAGDP